MFLVLEVKYPGRRNLRKAELVLAQSLRLQSITLGESVEQLAIIAVKFRKIKSCSLLLFSITHLYAFWNPSPGYTPFLR